MHVGAVDFFVCLFVCLFLAALAACGSSQAGDQIEAAALATPDP